MLRKHLAEFIIREGNKLVNEEVKNDDLVIKMIDLRERVSGIQNRAMEKDTQIDMTNQLNMSALRFFAETNWDKDDPDIRSQIDLDSICDPQLPKLIKFLL